MERSFQFSIKTAGTFLLSFPILTMLYNMFDLFLQIFDNEKYKKILLKYFLFNQRLAESLWNRNCRNRMFEIIVSAIHKYNFAKNLEPYLHAIFKFYICRSYCLLNFFSPGRICIDLNVVRLIQIFCFDCLPKCAYNKNFDIRQLKNGWKTHEKSWSEKLTFLVRFFLHIITYILQNMISSTKIDGR